MLRIGRIRSNTAGKQNGHFWKLEGVLITRTLLLGVWIGAPGLGNSCMASVAVAKCFSLKLQKDQQVTPPHTTLDRIPSSEYLRVSNACQHDVQLHASATILVAGPQH